MELIAEAGDAIRALELRLADEGLFAEARLEPTADLTLGWVRDKVTRRWRLMSHDAKGKGPQPRPLVEQPAAVKVDAARYLNAFEGAVRHAWAAKLLGPGGGE
jgi:hypothetical protein